MKTVWRLICYALGPKSGRTDRESNIIAAIRFLFVLQVLITNCFIIAGVIKHYNDVPVSQVSTVSPTCNFNGLR